MNQSGRNFLLWAIIIVFALVLFQVFQPGRQVSQKETSFSDFLTLVDANQVNQVTLKGNVIFSKTLDGQTFRTTTPDYPNLIDELRAKKVNITVAPPEEGPSLFYQLFVYFGPILLLIGFWLFMARSMQSGSNRAFGFGKSRARLLTEKSGKVLFSDVAGCDEAKEEVMEIVEFLRDPQKFQRLGGKIPKGVLLVGPPGTGKTLLARAIAGEANVPFFSISGSDFVEMFVGVGASRVRDLFEQGKKNAPCIIFIDEIDAVGRHRGAGLGGGNDEREQTLNQLLVEMDGFEANEGVILVAATNRPDVLDPALMRPGRFDRQVIVPLPDVKGRESILKVHMSKVPTASDVNAAVIARGTPGFSGADLMNLVNEASLLAARKNKSVVTMEDFELAKDKVMMGPERKSMVMTEEEKKLTAYHEGGHAIVALHVEGSDPIHKATIIPRGRALGMVVRLPETDRVSMARQKLYADLAVAMGGRIAEELIFGHEKVTTGASSDIRFATDMARRMVTEWGLSEELGPLSYNEPSGEVFLGHAITQHKNISEKTAEKIDTEIRKIVENAYKRARTILEDNLDDLHKLAQTLLEFETLSGDEIKALLKGISIAEVRKASEAAAASKSLPKSSTPLKSLSSAPLKKEAKKEVPKKSGTSPSRVKKS